MTGGSEQSVGIIGAGLSGALTSIYLAKEGLDVDVYEYRDDVRVTDYGSGRSINLALSTRGLTALRKVGLIPDIQKLCIRMYGRKLHLKSGETSFHSYGKPRQFIHSVSRNDLNEVLIREASKRGVDFHFNHKCTDVDLDAPSAYLEPKSGEAKTYEGDLLIGADGAYSRVREEFLKKPRFDYSQSYLEHGYKEFTIPSDERGDYQLEPHALHVWPRDNFMLIALPNIDGSFTCTLFLPLEGTTSFESLEERGNIEQFFETNFPSVTSYLNNIDQDFWNNPTGSLVTVRCEPYYHSDKVLLLGDAAHAVVPFYGQGMNAAFEDAHRLYLYMKKYNNDWEMILPRYSSERKPDADAIADLALYNYLEMRSLVKKPSFRAKHTLNSLLGDLFPKKWTPLYSLVTFSNTPYAKAKQKGERQKQILSKIVPERLIDYTGESIEFVQTLL